MADTFSVTSHLNTNVHVTLTCDTQKDKLQNIFSRYEDASPASWCDAHETPTRHASTPARWSPSTGQHERSCPLPLAGSKQDGCSQEHRVKVLKIQQRDLDLVHSIILNGLKGDFECILANYCIFKMCIVNF